LLRTPDEARKDRERQDSESELRVILAAVESPLAGAWERFCGDVPFVTVHRDSILDVAADAVVSPANSYGFMDGGIDALYMNHFGHEIQSRVPVVLRDSPNAYLAARAVFLLIQRGTFVGGAAPADVES
jgi:hypothetical protein